MALGIEDGSMTGLISNRGNQAGLVLSAESGTNTGGCLIGTPILTTPHSKYLSPFRIPVLELWIEEEGGDEKEGGCSSMSGKSDSESNQLIIGVFSNLLSDILGA